jgi:hypothetical protein
VDVGRQRPAGDAAVAERHQQVDRAAGDVAEDLVAVVAGEVAGHVRGVDDGRVRG